MFKITNTNNGKTFTHHTKMGVQQDETILERYGVPFAVEEIMDDMNTFGFVENKTNVE